MEATTFENIKERQFDDVVSLKKCLFELCARHHFQCFVRTSTPGSGELRCSFKAKPCPWTMKFTLNLRTHKFFVTEICGLDKHSHQLGEAEFKNNYTKTPSYACFTSICDCDFDAHHLQYCTLFLAFRCFDVLQIVQEMKDKGIFDIHNTVPLMQSLVAAEHLREHYHIPTNTNHNFHAGKYRRQREVEAAVATSTVSEIGICLFSNCVV